MTYGDPPTTEQEHRSTDRRSVLAFLGGVGAGALGTLVTVFGTDALAAVSDDPDTGAGRQTPADCETPTPRPTDDTRPAGASKGTTRESDPTHVKLAANAMLADHAEAFNDALHEAGLDEGITVEPLAGSRTTVTRRSRYEQWLQAEQSEPAMLLMDNGWTMPFIAREQLQRLDDLGPVSAVRDDYLDPLVATATGPDGGLYGQPLFVDVPTIQYRKDVLRQAGYGDGDFRRWATDPPTWQAFAAVVEQGRSALRDSLDVATEAYGFLFQADAYVGLSCCSFTEFMSGWGGAYFGDPSQYLFGPVGERPITVDEQPVRDAVRMVRSLIHGPDAEHTLDGYPGVSPGAVLEWTEEPSRKPFTDGQAVALRNWPYSIEINADPENFGRDLGVMPIPYAVTEAEARYPMTGGPVAALGGWHVTVNPYAPAATRRNAGKVLRAMRSESFQLWAFETVGWLPPRPSLFDHERVTGVDPLGAYADTLAVAAENAVPRPVTRVWPQESDAISTQVHAALAGEKSPGSATSDLKTKLRAIEQSVGT